MATSNDEIAEALTRHQIGLRRLGSGLAKRILNLLNEVEPDLRETIIRRLDIIERNGGIDAGPATTARLLRLRDRIQRLQAEAFEAINEETRETLIGLASQEVGLTQAVVTNALPVSVTFNRTTRLQLRSIVLSRPFQGRVLRDWMGSFETNDRRRMMDQIRIGMVQDETPTQIARRIFGTRALGGRDGTREITRRGAQALAQTAVAAISNNARAAWMEENAEFLSEELYVATLDARTTAICRSLDGKRFPVGKGPRPPLHINCRSLRVPIVDGLVLGDRPAVSATERELEGLRGPERRRRVRELVGRVPAETTYAQFLRRQTVSFQNEVLGVTKAKLFRDGGLELDRFVDRAGNELTLAELKIRERDAFIKAGLDPDDF